MSRAESAYLASDPIALGHRFHVVEHRHARAFHRGEPLLSVRERAHHRVQDRDRYISCGRGERGNDRRGVDHERNDVNHRDRIERRLRVSKARSERASRSDPPVRPRASRWDLQRRLRAARTRAARSASCCGRLTRSRPSRTQRSAARTPGPPLFERMRTRRPMPRGKYASAFAPSIISCRLFARRMPARRHRSSASASLNACDPVWRAAAAAPAGVVPPISPTIGLCLEIARTTLMKASRSPTDSA